MWDPFAKSVGLVSGTATLASLRAAMQASPPPVELSASGEPIRWATQLDMAELAAKEERAAGKSDAASESSPACSASSLSDSSSELSSALSAAGGDVIEADGRAANSWRHGMYARKIAVGEEEFAGFESLRAALTEQYRPRSVIAWMLVDRLARLQWKLMRAEESEVPMIRYAQTSYRSFHDGCYNERKNELPVEDAIASELKDDRSGLAKLQLFQMRLERSIYRTIGMLKDLRKSRGGLGKGRTVAAGSKSA